MSGLASKATGSFKESLRVPFKALSKLPPIRISGAVSFKFIKFMLSKLFCIKELLLKLLLLLVELLKASFIEYKPVFILVVVVVVVVGFGASDWLELAELADDDEVKLTPIEVFEDDEDDDNAVDAVVVVEV